MLKYQITLPEKVYHTLLTVAQQQGITPADWIAVHLSLAPPKSSPYKTSSPTSSVPLTVRQNLTTRFRRRRLGKALLQSWLNKGFDDHDAD